MSRLYNLTPSVFNFRHEATAEPFLTHLGTVYTRGNKDVVDALKKDHREPITLFSVVAHQKEVNYRLDHTPFLTPAEASAVIAHGATDMDDDFDVASEDSAGGAGADDGAGGGGYGEEEEEEEEYEAPDETGTTETDMDAKDADTPPARDKPKATGVGVPPATGKKITFTSPEAEDGAGYTIAKPGTCANKSQLSDFRSVFSSFKATQIPPGEDGLNAFLGSVERNLGIKFPALTGESSEAKRERVLKYFQMDEETVKAKKAKAESIRVAHEEDLESFHGWVGDEYTTKDLPSTENEFNLFLKGLETHCSIVFKTLKNDTFQSKRQRVIKRLQIKHA